MKHMMNLLIIAAHPDDEILGCGGTSIAYHQKGYTIHTLLLSKGIQSRDNWTQKQYDDQVSNILRANKKIGVDEKNIHVYDYPDQRFDTIPLLDIIKTIETIKEQVKPNIIFTHSNHCLNKDHTITYNAVITATRPLPNESVKQIFSFEIPSSTEWNQPSSFSPTVFIDIKETIEQKLRALQEYKDEMKPFPHPRSYYGIYQHAQHIGMQIGVPFAEQFELVRMVQ